MEEKQNLVCNKPCWDSKATRLYTFGEKAMRMIDPSEPLAQYFDGWPPGTEVYHKKNGVLGGKEPVITTRKIPEAVVPDQEQEPDKF